MTLPAGYILQRINRLIFKDPEALMQNLGKVTDYLREKVKADGGDPTREVLHLVRTQEGCSFYKDSNQDYWRLLDFIEGARTYETANEPQQVYQGWAGDRKIPGPACPNFRLTNW